MKTFTKHDLTEIINGGPLTMEIHDKPKGAFYAEKIH